MLKGIGNILLLLAVAILTANASNPFDGETKKPSQIHIALAGRNEDGDSNGMNIMWNTKLKTDTTVVKYGLTEKMLDKVATGTSSAYYVTYNHQVTLHELKPDTVYYYSVGDEKGGFSKERSFRTAPLHTQLRKNWSFAYIADLGVVNGAPTTDYIGTMVPSSTSDEDQNADSARFVWHGGDVGYADDSFLHWGCYARFCYENTFDDYMVAASEQWAAQVPYMTTPGNHEADCHSPACLALKSRREKLSNFTAYNERFHMPSAEVNGTLNMHYSFNYGNVHFISMDTETGFPGAPLAKRYVLPCGGFADQMAWIEKDLFKANLPENRAKQPWILAAGHRPMYSMNEVNTEFQAALEDLFYKYGVDMYFTGHKHFYSRNYPTYGNVVEQEGYNNPKATSSIIAGGSGNDEMTKVERKLIQEQEKARDDAAGVTKPISPEPEDISMTLSDKSKSSSEYGPWTAIQDVNQVGATKVTIIDDSTLRVDYIRTKTGEIYDTMTLYRDHSFGRYPQELPSGGDGE